MSSRRSLPVLTRAAQRFRPVGLLLALAATSCGRGPSAPPRVASGEWTLLRFLGGPPRNGQITDTVRVDPGAGSRHVRIERNRAGVAEDRSCEADVAEDPAWAELVAALAAPDLVAALAHPERVPPLLLDAGYFACTHAGTRIALSDLEAPGGAPDTAAAVAALHRLLGAYQRVLASVTVLPACKAL